MSNPNHILPILGELIEVYKNPKMFKFIHIPIQSASNKILKDMQRGYKIKDVETIIKSFTKEFPEMTIATDIIVGYPTEDSKDHQTNLHFLETYKPNIFNLSKFSKHKDTLANKLKELPIKIIKTRATELMQTHRTTALKQKEQFLGKTIKALVEKRLGENLHQARDENYNIILVKCPKDKLGNIIDIKINKAGVHHLIGELI